MKVLFIFCVIASLTLFAFTWAEDRECNPPARSTLLSRKHVYRPPLKHLAQEIYMTYPTDTDTEYAKVSGLCIFHHEPGTIATIAYGVEHDWNRILGSATLSLRGQESRAVNSTVEFYGSMEKDP